MSFIFIGRFNFIFCIFCGCGNLRAIFEALRILLFWIFFRLFCLGLMSSEEGFNASILVCYWATHWSYRCHICFSNIIAATTILRVRLGIILLCYFYSHLRRLLLFELRISGFLQCWSTNRTSLCIFLRDSDALLLRKKFIFL